MAVKINKRLVDHLRTPGAKKTWVSNLQPLGVNYCPNCAGYGFHVVFIAIAGPLKAPAPPYSGKSSKWCDGSWWAGQGYTAPCPVCNGNGTRNK
jgi:hypothetical protein